MKDENDAVREPRASSGAEVAFVGRHLKTKAAWILVLSGMIPLLILIYVLGVHVLPSLDLTRNAYLVIILGLLVAATAVLIAGGGFVLWDLVRAVTRAAEVAGATGNVRDLVDRQDEIGRLMTSYAGMLETIERQAGELREFGARLETANRALEAANVELRELSFKDELTGLYNRRFFWLRLAEEAERCARFRQRGAVLLLDLDGFKAVNDECGHPAGDETLRQVAGLLARHSRGVDVVARLGGDEFVLLLPQTEEAGARRCAERVREAIGEHRFDHGRPITTSIGIAEFGMASGSAEDVMRVADDALYQAKRAGKNAIRLGAPGLGVADPLLAEADFDRLLELIVTKAREATVADAGSLYLMEDPSSEARVLRFVVAQNDSRTVRVEDVRLPVDRNSVAGYVAATGKLINVADVYDLPPDAEFRVDPRTDSRTGYRTVSMLGVPLIDDAGQVMGVLQLINKKRSPRVVLETPEMAVAESRAFGNADQQVVVALATLAAMAIRGRRAEEARARLEAELQQRNR